MVLCKFYQQGSCRFGTKCTNEHFDVKQIVKSDVEAAINGKQWPFSCFGPFKDKPCIPNFIDDQSFEEVRFMCYEAKQKNYFDQFHQKFVKEALEANNKMKTLLELSPDVVELVTQVYDMPIDTVAAGVAATGSSSSNSSNPFGGGSSLFAKSTVPASTPSTWQSGAFSSTANTGFGINSTQPQTSIFGQQAAKPAHSIFGGGAQAPVAAMSGIFAQAAQQTLPSATSGGVGIFAQAAQQTAQTQQPQSTAANFGLFAQAAQQTAPAFAQQNQNPFGQSQQQQQNTSIFGQQTQQSGNLFAPATAPTTAAAPVGGGLFANAAAQTQNIFAQAAAATTVPQQQQQPQQNGMFAQAMQQQQQQQTPSFMQQQQPQVHLQNPAFSSTTYSKLQELTADEIEAFKANAFEPGKIPFSPPPRELV